MTDTVNKVTLGIFIGFWPVWLGWEIALLAMRGAGWAQMPGLISMVARDRAWSLPVVVWLWCGLGAHFFWNASTTATVWGSILFWALALGLLVWNVATWNSAWETWSLVERYARWPVLWAVLGTLAGRFLFPQVGRVPWGR